MCSDSRGKKRVRLVTPHSSLRFQTERLFPSSACDLEAAPQLILDSPDITVIPLLTESGESGIPIVIQACNSKASGSIFALSRSSDTIASKCLKKAGANLVLYPNDTFDRWVQQSSSNSQSHESSAKDDQRKLLLNVMQTLDEGVVILTDDFKILFCNDSATKGLGGTILQDASNRELFEGKLRTAAQGGSDIQEFDFRSFSGSIKIEPIFGSDRVPLGYVASLIDKRSVQRISEALAQGERTHALLLMATAVCIKLLRTGSLGSPGKPIEFLEKSLAEGVDYSDIQRAITTSCEILDIILSPLTAIKIRSTTSSIVAVSAPELFRLIGFMLFVATDFAGPGGEVHINAERHEGSTITVLTLAAKRVRSEQGVPYDLVLQRMRSAREMLFLRDGSLKKLPYGLQEARAILQKVGGTFKYREHGDDAVEYIIQLPNKSTSNDGAV